MKLMQITEVSLVVIKLPYIYVAVVHDPAGSHLGI